MSAISKNPANPNFISQLGFKFSIKKLPNVNFFIQEVAFPAINLPSVDQPNPFVISPHTGDHIEYDPLILSFKVDEDFTNYRELHSWIRGQGFPTDFSEYKELADKPKYSGDGLYTDASLIVTTNSKNPNIEFTFKECFPVALSGFTLNTTDTQVNYLTCQATFKYTYFDIFVLP